MSFIINILFAVFYCLALSGVGYLLSKYLFKVESDFIECFFTGTLLIIPILFFAGILSYFSLIFFVIFLILLLAFSIPGRRLISRLHFDFRKEYILPIVILLGLLLINGLASLSPPTKDDTLFYNLGVPRLWVASGNIDFIPTIPFSASPLNSELLLTPLMAIGSPETAQFFVFLVSVLTMFAIARIIQRHFDISIWLGLILTATVSSYIAISTNAKNDFLYIGYAALAFLYYFDYIQSRKIRYIILAGIMAGMMAGTKTNALILLAVLPIVMIISRDGVKPLIYFVAASAAFACPWYVKAFVETGNPVYPFYDSLFHSPYWNGLFDSYNKATYVAMDNKSILNFTTSPFRMVFLPDIFRARLGPIPFMFLPLLLFTKNIPVVIRRSLIMLAIFYPIWYVVLPNARYLFPVLPLMVVIAGFVLKRYFHASELVKYTAIAGLSCLLLLGVMRAYRDGKSRITAAVGIVDRVTFLKNETVLDPNQTSTASTKKALAYFDTWEYLNKSSSPEAMVAILCSNWDRADGFYLDRQFLYLNPTEQTIVDFTGSRDDIEIDLILNGVDYIVVDSNVVDEFSAGSRWADAEGFGVFSRGVGNFLSILEDSGRLEYSDSRYQLYRMGL